MQLQVWEWFLLFGAAYIAVLSLSGLMRQRRAELVDKLTRQAIAEQSRQRDAEKAQLKAERKKQIAEAKKRKAA